MTYCVSWTEKSSNSIVDAMRPNLILPSNNNNSSSDNNLLINISNILKEHKSEIIKEINSKLASTTTTDSPTIPINTPYNTASITTTNTFRSPEYHVEFEIPKPDNQILPHQFVFKQWYTPDQVRGLPHGLKRKPVDSITFHCPKRKKAYHQKWKERKKVVEMMESMGIETFEHTFKEYIKPRGLTKLVKAVSNYQPESNRNTMQIDKMLQQNTDNQ